VINYSVISTSSNEKQSGKWIKISDKSYQFYLSSSKVIGFLFENEKIICNSEYEICKELE